jgi:hypothetical protein
MKVRCAMSSQRSTGRRAVTRARALRVAAFALAAAAVMPVVHAPAASAHPTCSQLECGTNHNEGAARDGSPDAPRG